MSSAEQIPLIRGELAELRECVSCLSVDTNAMRNGNPIAARAVAFDLAALYSGIERVIKLCLEPYDGLLRESPHEHSNLLTRAGAPIEKLRPAVVSTKTADELRDLMGFRDLAWAASPEVLKETRLLAIARGIPAMHKLFMRDVEAFIQVLDRPPKEGED